MVVDRATHLACSVSFVSRPFPFRFVEDRKINDKRYNIDSGKLLGLQWEPETDWNTGITKTSTSVNTLFHIFVSTCVCECECVLPVAVWCENYLKRFCIQLSGTTAIPATGVTLKAP